MNTNSPLWPAGVPKTIPELVRLLRKAELHVHLEGTLEPEFAFQKGLSVRATRTYPTPDALREAYTRFTCLDDFLGIYYANCEVLRREVDFYDLTWAYIQRANANNVVHVEPFIDTQQHLNNHLTIEEVMVPIQQALKNAYTTFGITSNLIPCFLRHLPPEDAMANYRLVKPYLPLGFGLDSSEMKFPPELFKDVFDALRADGFLAFAHAGEEGSWHYVQQAVDVLQVSGIDHGDNSLENVVFAGKLGQRRLPNQRRIRLTVCPFSRLRLGGIKSLKEHKIRMMLAFSLFASLHSDDPAYFLAPDGADGYINNNYIYTAAALGLVADEVVELCNNSLEGAFMDDELAYGHMDHNNRLLVEYKAAA